MLFACVAAVGLFAFVVALANFVRDLLGPLLAGQLGIPMLVRLLLLLVPFAISYALPMGVLTGVLLTLGRLSADSEVTAMRAAGIGIVRIARPVFLFGLLGAAGALYVNFESMPWARAQYHREFADAIRTHPLSFIVPKTFVREFRGLVVYVGEREDRNDMLRDVWVWKLDDQSRVEAFIRAESGSVVYDDATNSLVLTLFHAQAEERDPASAEDFSRSPRVASWERTEQARLPLERYLGQTVYRMKPEWLTYSQLQQERRRLAAAPGTNDDDATISHLGLAMVISEKVNLSIAVFAFAFVAVPLGIRVSRRETSANLGVAVLLVLVYYLLLMMVKWLDHHPEYRPDLLLGLPNLLFLGFGFWLIRRIER